MLQTIIANEATSIITSARELLNNLKAHLAETTRELNHGTTVNLVYTEERLNSLFAIDCISFLNDEELEELQTIHHALTVEHEALTAPPKSSVAGWGEPKELPVTLPTAPTLPLDLLPPAVRGWLVDEAERANLSPEMIAVPFIISLGGVLGRKIGVFPKQYDTWFEVPNLWGAIVAGPSVKKSLALSTGTKFLSQLDERDIQAHKTEMEASATERKALALNIERLENRLRRHKVDEETLEALEKSQQRLKELELPQPRRIANDMTIEKMGEIMSENPNGLTCIRDELAGLLSTYNKQGREGDRAFYLEAWNGKNSFTSDRISRKSVLIPALTLSLVGGIQPGKINRHVVGATAGADEADGLLQRFQLLVYPDTQPDFKLVDRRPNTEAFERVKHLVEQLDQIDPNTLAAEMSSYGIPALRFTLDAQEVFNAWYTALNLEFRNRDLESAPAYIAHLGKYASLMPTLALIFHLLDVANGTATSSAISKEAAERAVGWCNFLKQHARKLYAVELARATNPALDMAEKILDGTIKDGMTVREIQRKKVKGCPTVKEVRTTLNELEQLNWVKVEKVSTGTKPSSVVRINPAVYEEL